MGMNHDQRRKNRAKNMRALDKSPEDRPDEWASVEAGEDAKERALIEWREDIVEPQGEVSEGPILERYMHEGSGWTGRKTYKNRRDAWCGFFAAFCWISVQPKIRKKCFPSTYRLWEWGKGTPRQIKKLEDARPGDILVIKTATGKRWGDHITIIDKIEDDLSGAWTIEGNAYGETPTRERAEGVVRCFREIEKIKFIYRPLEVDLT